MVRFLLRSVYKDSYFVFIIPNKFDVEFMPH